MPNIGFCMVSPQPEIAPGHVVQVARKCEEIGLHSMWVLDRVVYDNLEPLTQLAAAAAVTSKIRLGTSVLLAALRPPALLAKSVATLDFISNGKREWVPVLSEFWGAFSHTLAEKQDVGRGVPLGEKCPKCKKGQLYLQNSKRGLFVGCNRYPDCDYTRPWGGLADGRRHVADRRRHEHRLQSLHEAHDARRNLRFDLARLARRSNGRLGRDLELPRQADRRCDEDREAQGRVARLLRPAAEPFALPWPIALPPSLRAA